MAESRLLDLPIRLLRWGLRPLRPSRPERPPRDLAVETGRVQLDIILKALGGTQGVGMHDRDGDGYLYRPGQVLVLVDDVLRLKGFFQERQEDFEGMGRARRTQGDLMRYSIPRRRDGGDVPETLDELDEVLGEGVVRPDHILFVTPGWGHLCPATEPEVPLNPQPLPPLRTDPAVGRGIRVSVVDTGWWEEAGKTTPWLGEVEGDPETVDPAAIHPYAGHGTFVAGVVRCLAPGTEIEVEGLLPFGGAAYESDITRELNEAMTDRDDPELISISAGTYTRRNLGLLAFEALSRAQDLIEGEKAALVVAAAGNDASDRPFFPAAYDWVVGVGALDDDGCVSDFSNVGPWVDVYAHGRDLVNAFPIGTYTCHEPLHAGEVRTFEGRAQWSGTSFSTPVVSGAIAAHMSTHGTTSRQARDALVAAGKALNDPRAGAIVAVGPPFA